MKYSHFFRSPQFLLVFLWFVAVALGPRNATSLTSHLALIAYTAGVAVMRPRERALGSGDWMLLAALSAPVLVLVVMSALAENPVVSLVGMIGLRAGSLLWLVTLGLFWVSHRTAHPRDFSHVVIAIALLSIPLGGAAGLEAAGVVKALAYPGPPTGVMDSSSSLGQLLMLTAICGTSWSLSSQRGRPLALVAAAFSIGGLIVAGSLGAWVGLGAAAVSGWAIWLSRSRPAITSRILTISFAALCLIALSLTWSIGVAAKDPARSQQLAALTHDRSTIWAAATNRVQVSPIFGGGSAQFSAWSEWDTDPELGSFRYTGSYDPHNIALYWLTAGGVLGAAVAVFGALVLFRRLLAQDRQSRSPWSAANIGALCAMLVSSLFSWTTPIALGLLAVLLGSALGSTRNRESTSEPLWPSMVLVASATALIAAFMMSGAAYEYRWASQADEGTIRSDLVLEAGRATPDPTYWVLLAQANDAEAVSEAKAELLEHLDRAASWHVGAAVTRFEIMISEADSSQIPIKEALEDGKRADGATGMWDYLGAVYYGRTGNEQLAQEYRNLARGKPLPEKARAYIE